MELYPLTVLIASIACGAFVANGQTAATTAPLCDQPNEVFTTAPCHNACELACPPPRKVTPACPDRCYQNMRVVNRRTRSFGKCMCDKGLFRRQTDRQCVPLHLCSATSSSFDQLSAMAERLLEQMFTQRSGSGQAAANGLLASDTPRGVLNDAFGRILQRFMTAFAAANYAPPPPAAGGGESSIDQEPQRTSASKANDVPDARGDKEAGGGDGRANTKPPKGGTAQGGSSVPLADDKCRLPIEQGARCANSRTRTSKSAGASVRYAYDVRSEGCRAFAYAGCGGNGNNFASVGACQSACLLPDGGGECALGASALRDAERPDSAVFCGTHPDGRRLDDDACPPTHRCRMGAFFGLCCPRNTEELSMSSTSDKCKSGKAAATVPYDRPPNAFDTTLVGVRCAHNFCPEGTVCEQRRMTAVCCPK